MIGGRPQLRLEDTGVEQGCRLLAVDINWQSIQLDNGGGPMQPRSFILGGFLLASISGPAFGQRALSSDTVGSSAPTVSAPASFSFSIDGDFELGGFVFKDGAPFLHNAGGFQFGNTALGQNALVSVTPGDPESFSGQFNTALGRSALNLNSTGRANTSLGSRTLSSNTGGTSNTATGYGALNYNLGSRNTATGSRALFYNTSGGDNTANGVYALNSNDSGSRNIALGYSAGTYNIAGSSNIFIGNYGADESNTLRIGQGTGMGDFQQNRAFISGIRSVTLAGTEPHVCIDDSTDQLGLCFVAESSARFKEDIKDMTDGSEGIFSLRPVRFRYKKEVVGEGERPVQYGLIAEEVAEIYPQLVTFDNEGLPYTVRYDALTPLLLNELQKQQAELVELRATKARVKQQEAIVRELHARLARLEAAETASDPISHPSLDGSSVGRPWPPSPTCP